MQSLQTLSMLVAPAPERDGDLVEIAGGRPYELSSAYGTSSRKGVVEPRGDYFFHTGFGTDQSIRVDLGRRHRVRRIEVSNRQGRPPGAGETHLRAARRWARRRRATRLPDVRERARCPAEPGRSARSTSRTFHARYVTITSPMNTALHFSDLRIYAADGDGPIAPVWRRAARRALRSVRSRIRRPRRD